MPNSSDDQGNQNGAASASGKGTPQTQQDDKDRNAMDKPGMIDGDKNPQIRNEAASSH